MEVTPFDFRIHVEELDDRTVLSVVGDVDLATSSIVLNRVEALFQKPIAIFALDLGAVTFLDSSGLAALLRAHTLADEHDVPFTFAAVSPEVRRVVKGAGLAEVLRIDP